MNIPVWVMEGLRGGSLCQLSPEHEQNLNALRPNITATEWAFRFLQSIDGITVILSGMSNMTQLKQNIEVFSEKKPLTQKEMNALFEIAEEITAKNTLLCTGCRYCTECCPANIDIPAVVKLYNKNIFRGSIDSIQWQSEKTPHDCIECASCEQMCPQNIKISEMMADIKTKKQL